MFKKVAITLIAIMLLLIIILPNISHLNSISRKELAEIVDRDLVVFNQSEIPQTLLTKLSRYKVVMLGEIHDIQEYPSFLFKLTTQLNQSSGFSTLLLETCQAYSWIYEDYATGLIDLNDTKANKMLYFTTCIKDIRDYNLNLAQENKIKVHTIDYNGNRTDFVWSLEKMQEIINNNTLADLINDYKNVLDYNKCTSILNKYKTILEDENSGLNDKWHQRLTRMINVEISSIQIRKHMNLQDDISEVRESLIKKTTDEYLKTAIGNTLINIGGTHIQKTAKDISNIEFLGEYLINESPYAKNNTYNILITFKELKGIFRLNVNIRFKNELLRIISGNVNNNRTAFMPFEDQVFESENITFYWSELLYTKYPLKQVYDALFFLPRSTHILKEHNYRQALRYYFNVFVLMVLIIWLIVIIYRIKDSGLCPKCRWPIFKAGYIEVFKGARDENTDEVYGALAVVIQKCPKCNLEYHSLSKKPVYIIGGRKNQQNLKKIFDSKHYYRDIVMSFNKSIITKKEYNEIVQKIKNAINKANEKYFEVGRKK